MGEGCDYCNKTKRIEEIENDNIYGVIYGPILRIYGTIGEKRFLRDFKANFCIKCGRKL